MEKIELFTTKDSLPSETTIGVTVYYSDSAKVKVKIKAGQIDHYAGEAGYSELTDGVTVFFYNTDGEVESELTSKKAIHREQDRIMEALEDVIVINRKGEMLNTERLIWMEEEGKIYSDQFVKITTGDEIIYGDSMEANQDFTQWKIMNIKGTIQINEEDSIDEEVQ